MLSNTVKKIKRNINGIFILNKPYGISSNKALQKVRYIFSAKKAGHTGSLDPLATGVLPIFFGRTTKFCQYLLDADKGYIATIKLGANTTTGDIEGDIINTSSVAVSQLQIEQALKTFYGFSEQIPSMYSALKHKGKKLYEYARQGITIPREKRSIRIDKIELVEYNSSDTFTIKVLCSKGTYIRTLAEDIGLSLGTLAHLIQLHRYKAGEFTDDMAVDITELQNHADDQQARSLNQFNTIDNHLINSDQATLAFEKVYVSELDIIKLKQGVAVSLTQNNADNSMLRIYLKTIDSANSLEEFIGLGYIKQEMLWPKHIL